MAKTIKWGIDELRKDTKVQYRLWKKGHEDIFEDNLIGLNIAVRLEEAKIQLKYIDIGDVVIVKGTNSKGKVYGIDGGGGKRMKTVYILHIVVQTFRSFQSLQN